jgi:hypothetical protein
MYSGFVHLDFDKLTPEQLDAAFKVIAEIPTPSYALSAQAVTASKCSLR